MSGSVEYTAWCWPCPSLYGACTAAAAGAL